MRISTALAAALALALSAASPEAFAAPGAQVLNGRQQFVDLNGQPIVGGSVYVYQPGTTTPAATYQDPGLSTLNPSPVVLDGRGQASIWAPPGSYREQVFDALGDLIWDATTVAIGSTAAALAPGAAIGAGGDVSCPGQVFTGASAVTLACTLAPVGNGKLAPAQPFTIKGNNTAGSAAPTDLAAPQVTAMLAPFGGDGLGNSKGLVPAPNAGDASKVLTGAGAFQPVAARAWAVFDGSSCASSCTILASYNVASVVQTSAGHVIVTFSSPLANANYAVVAMGASMNTSFNTDNAVAVTASSFGLYSQCANGNAGSCSGFSTRNAVVVFGN